jgi:dTDP-4-amino-4,6-dideoxygalactose transaminase
MAICIEHYILWKYFLDIQDRNSYSSTMQKQCLIKLWLIEDAAQALLSNYQGRYVGTFGQLGCLSFHETKNIISGEGGALLINDQQLIERAEIIWEKGTNRSQFFRGQVDKYTWVDIGSSYLPSDILAAFLYAQMENAEQIIANRNQTFNLYMEGLRPLADRGCLQLPLVEKDSRCNGHIFYIITGSLEERDRLINFLKRSGISALFHYVPLHSSPAGLKYGRTNGSLATTDWVSDRLLRLPLYYDMAADDLQFIIAEVSRFYRT